jgi:hypothetical protein
MRRLTSLLLLGILVIAAIPPVQASGLSRSGAITTRLSLDLTRVTAGQVIHGVLVIVNTARPVDLTLVATVAIRREGRRVTKVTGCRPFVGVGLGNRSVQQFVGFAAICSAAPFLLRHGSTRIPFIIETSYTQCLQQGGSQVTTGSTIPKCTPSNVPPVLPVGRYRTFVAWSEHVPVPAPKAVSVTITSGT